MENIEDQIRGSISDLIEDPSIEVETLQIQEKVPESVRLDLEQTTFKKAREKAISLLDSILKVYVSNDFISNSEYLNARLNLNTSTLASIIRQIEITEKTITSVSETIEMGETNPKYYMTLNQLQKGLIDLFKFQKETISDVEEDFKRIGEELDDVKIAEAEQNAQTNRVKVTSTKELVKMLKHISLNTDIEENNDVHENS